MFKNITIYITFFLYVFNLSAQKIIQGKIVHKVKSETLALEGANVYWKNTNIGTITDESGDFNIYSSDKTNKLIISFLGFITDTLTISSDKKFVHFLTEDLTTNLVLLADPPFPASDVAVVLPRRLNAIFEE